jgi:hypothetical protein
LYSWLDVFRWVSHEFLSAPVAAEKIPLLIVYGRARLIRHNAHAAYGISDGVGTRRCAVDSANWMSAGMLIHGDALEA